MPAAESNPALVKELRAEIAANGPITLARFMEVALYDPDHGYYRTATRRPGREGDFLTAPETHPFFGFALARQVQITCDTAKLGAARLAGRTAPTHDDNETTIEQLQARLRSVIGYLSEYSAKDFDGAGARQITQPRWAGKIMLGADYFHEHVIPNFYFHAAHTYAILRHVGVPLGKRDYLGALSMRDP